MSVYISTSNRNALIALLIIASIILGYNLFKTQVKTGFNISPLPLSTDKEFKLTSEEKAIYEIEVSDISKSMDKISKELAKTKSIVRKTEIFPNNPLGEMLIKIPKSKLKAVEQIIVTNGSLRKSEINLNPEEQTATFDSTMLQTYRELEKKNMELTNRKNISIAELEMIQVRLEELRHKIKELEAEAEKMELKRRWDTIKLILVKTDIHKRDTASAIIAYIALGAKLLLFIIIAFLLILISFVPLFWVGRLLSFVLNYLGIKTRTSMYAYYTRSHRKKKIRKSSKTEKDKDNEQKNHL